MTTTRLANESIPWQAIAQEVLELDPESQDLAIQTLAQEWSNHLSDDALASIVVRHCHREISRALRVLVRRRECQQLPWLKRGPVLSMEEIASQLTDLQNDFVASLRRQWDGELLAMTFPTKQGRVAWGDASAEQHLDRAEMLRVHADATVATAGLHEKAASQIEEAGAANLYDAMRRS